MENAAVKSIRLPMFDGKPEKFQVWWTRFRAYAGVFGFIKALKKGGETALPPTEDALLDDTSETDKLMIAALKRNAIAMANLTMAFTTDATMALVYESLNDEDWPGGLAHKVIDALKKKYQPQDTMTRVELRQMLNKVSMKKEQDPASIFEQLSSIKNRYNTKKITIDEADLIAVSWTLRQRNIKPFSRTNSCVWQMHSLWNISVWP